MPETDPDAAAPADRRVDLRRPGFRRTVTFDLAPGAAERTALAAELGLIALPALRFRGRVEPLGRSDAALTARLLAEIVQRCGLTLAPVPATIDEAVNRRYLADWAEPETEETEVPEDDTAEPLPPVLDLTALMAEALALALPPFPRAPGAEFAPLSAAPPGVEPLRDERRNPFAALAALRRGAGETPPDGGEDPG